MKLNKLYIAILLIAGILTSCKVGKSYVRPDLHLPDSLTQHQDTVSFGDQDWEEIYTDSTLRSLIDRALDHNKDMLIAAARIKEMAAQKRISTAAPTRTNRISSAAIHSFPNFCANREETNALHLTFSTHAMLPTASRPETDT